MLISPPPFLLSSNAVAPVMEWGPQNRLQFWSCLTCDHFSVIMLSSERLHSMDLAKELPLVTGKSCL